KCRWAAVVLPCGLLAGAAASCGALCFPLALAAATARGWAHAACWAWRWWAGCPAARLCSGLLRAAVRGCRGPVAEAHRGVCPATARSPACGARGGRGAPFAAAGRLRPLMCGAGPLAGAACAAAARASCR
ncbi:uncharacterized protein Tco025E_10199, partial [Trypanosoma conorhini]